MTQSEPQGSSTSEGQSSAAPSVTDLVLARKDERTGNYLIPSPVQGAPLEFRPGAKCLTEEQFALLGPLGMRREFDPAAVMNFLMDAASRGFNPWAGEIFLMRYKSVVDGVKTWMYVHHIGINGMRRHVTATQKYRGIKATIYGDDSGKWHDFWPYEDKLPYVCRAQLIHPGWDELVQNDAYFAEYAPMIPIWGEKQGEKIGEQLAPFWRLGKDGGKANLMIRKCALAGGFREGWPALLGNWYDTTEMEQRRVESDEIQRREAAAAGADDTATRRAAAYMAAQGRTVVDGLEVGAEVIAQGDAEPVDQVPADRVRAMLLAERDAIAAITGSSPEFITERWSAARGGAAFDTWESLGEMAAHLTHCRRHVATVLRGQGRVEMAERYAAAEMPAPLLDLFGVPTVADLMPAEATR